MSKIENKWEYMTGGEKEKAYEGLCELIRKKQQKEQPNKKSIEKRIKDIRKKWPIGIRIT